MRSPWFTVNLLHSISFWIMIVALAVIVLFALLILLAAYLEKRYLRPLTQAGQDAPARTSGKGADWVIVAENLLFANLGYFVERGFSTTYVTLLLSQDQQVLALIVHKPLARFLFMSRLADDRWVGSYFLGGSPDLSGLEIRTRYSGTFEEVLGYHHEQLRGLGIQVIPFDRERVIEDLQQHERACAERLLSQGLARWRSADQSAWSFNLKGSVIMTVRSLKQMRTSRSV
jgi:hypothetical protein